MSNIFVGSRTVVGHGALVCNNDDDIEIEAEGTIFTFTKATDPETAASLRSKGPAYFLAPEGDTAGSISHVPKHLLLVFELRRCQGYMVFTYTISQTIRSVWDSINT